MLVVGFGFESGSHPNCWLGAGRSNATAYEGGSRLRCVSPPGINGSAYRTLVSVSLNAQQVSDDAPFIFYPTPHLKELVPDSGDAGVVETGTLVRVLAAEGSVPTNFSFNDSTDLRCRFGHGDGGTTASIVPAYHWTDDNETRSGIECVSPAAVDA